MSRGFVNAAINSGYHAYKLIGQSNGVGYANIGTAPSDLRSAFTKTDVFNFVTGNIEPLTPGVNNSTEYINYASVTNLGCELRLMRLLEGTNVNSKKLLIKCCKGATNMYSNWAVPGGYMYQGSRDVYNATKAKADFILKAIVFVQGESDVINGNYLGYQAGLEALIAQERINCGDPTVPFIIVRLSSNMVLDATGLTFVQNVQTIVAQQPYNKLVDMNDQICGSDGVVHYAAAQYDVMAQRVFSAIQQT